MKCMGKGLQALGALLRERSRIFSFCQVIVIVFSLISNYFLSYRFSFPGVFAESARLISGYFSQVFGVIFSPTYPRIPVPVL